jgi:hypothetical protein
MTEVAEPEPTESDRSDALALAGESATALVGVPAASYGESWQAHALDLYGRYLTTAENTRSLRAQANTFLLSANSLLLSLSGALLSVSDDPAWLVVMPVAGVLLTVTWIALLTQYRRLNRVKLAVLTEIEQLLPIRPFNREDSVFVRYIPLSKVEQAVAALFAAVYVALAIAALVAA